MNKIPRITKCESIAKMTNDEVKIMILEKQIENQAEIIRKQSEKIIPENLDLHNRINKAIEYIENNQLYEEEWDYDSNDEPYSWGCNDTNATNELLSILRGEDNE